MSLTAIYARAANGVIGRDGAIPWHIRADLKRFKALTMGPDNQGKPMIMGRKTFDSLGKPLPGRRHIVLTRDRDWRAEGAEVAHTPENALALAGDGASLIGGAEIYRLMLGFCDRVELTEIHAEYEGGVTVPDLGPEWREVAREDHPAEGDHPGFAFVTLERNR